MHKTVGTVALLAMLLAYAPAGAAEGTGATAAALQAWQVNVAQVPQPSAKGCFTAGYPALEWKQIGCTAPPRIPMPPKPGPRPLVVGAGNSISAQVPSGFISNAIGSFDNVANVTSISSPIGNLGAPVDNAYTLQLNTNFFASTACAGSPNPGCLGWEQFVLFNNGVSGQVFIQYWLLDYNAPCPDASWNQFSFTGNPDIYCWKNSAGAVAVGNQPITNLEDMSISGAVSATGDSVTLWVDGTAYMTAGDNAVDAANGWTIAEFNVFGAGGNSNGGGMASFNDGAALTVRTRTLYGGTDAPICTAQGFTAETNNLSFGDSPPAATPPGPAIIFNEDTDGGAPSNCAAAAAIGDTHQRTFSGLLYDFQAAGDFVEAQIGPAFEVQTRKVSGAPTWPDTSINRSVATRMGATRVVLCDGSRLVVDGVNTALPAGKAISLPSGVDITRVGNVYFVTDQSGNSLRVAVKSGYIDVSVGAGTWPATVRGLLGNPNNDPRRLEARTGAQFSVPVSFELLYRYFGDSWRVNPAASLLSPCGTQTEQRNPARPFFAGDLNPSARERARTVCVQAKVPTVWLNPCILDVAVIGDKAAAVYVGAKPPTVINP